MTATRNGKLRASDFSALWRLTLGFVLCLAGIPLTAYGVMWWRHRLARESLSLLLQEIRASGEPLTVEELDALYPFPADQVDRSAELLPVLQAFEIPRLLPTESARLPWHIHDSSEERYSRSDATPVAETHLRLYAKELASLHAVSSWGGNVRYPPEFVPRIACRTLVLEFRSRLDRMDRQGALKSLQTLIELNESLRQDPAQYWRWTVFDFIAEEIEAFLAEDAATAQELDELERRIKAVDFSQGLKLSMRDELVNTYHYMLRLDVELPNDLVDPGPLTKSRPAECAEILRIRWNKAMVADRPYPDALLLWIELERERESLGKVEQTRIGLLQRPLLATEASWGSVTGHSWAKAVVKRDALCAAIAVERFRLWYGRRPNQVEELVPAFLSAAPVDPYLQSHLRISDDGAAYSIYSVGPNRRDDGGNVSEPYWNPPDIGITVRHRPTP